MFTFLKDRYSARQHDGQLDAGDVVQTVILVAGFSIMVLVLVIWIGTAVMNKGVDGSKCVEGSQTSYTDGTSAASCDGTTASQGNNSFTKNNSDYASRY